MDFIGAFDQNRLQTVFLVHGDPERQAKLDDALGKAAITNVENPARGESVEL